MANAQADAQQEQEVEAAATASSKLQNVVTNKGFWQGVLGTVVAGLLWKVGLLTPGNVMQRHQGLMGTRDRQIDLADECIRDTYDMFLDGRHTFNPFRMRSVGGWPHNTKSCSRYMDRYKTR